MQETWVWSLGGEDPLEKEWQPTPVFLPGEFYGQRSLVGYSPWGHKESDMAEWLTHTHTHTHTQRCSFLSQTKTSGVKHLKIRSGRCCEGRGRTKLHFMKVEKEHKWLNIRKSSLIPRKSCIMMLSVARDISVIKLCPTISINTFLPGAVFIGIILKTTHICCPKYHK